MKNDDIYSLMGRILSGEADPKDEHQFQEWLKSSADNQVIYDNMRNVWNQTRTREEYSNADRVFQKVLNKRDQPNQHQGHPSLEKRFRSLWWKAGVAAVLILLAGISVLGLLRSSQPELSEEQIAWTVKENPAGQKSKILLRDGTIVWLNSESKIRYLSDFSDNLREVELFGEAYFEVAKDSTRPFVVRSGELQTTALGTAFNVRHYLEDSLTVIFLEEGSVKVEKEKNDHSSEILEPGWGVYAVNERSDLQKFEDQSLQWTGWKDGVLSFKEASLDEVIRVCERWYSVDISIQGSPETQWEFTGMFKNESLENVLESMRYGKDFQYAINNKQITLIF